MEKNFFTIFLVIFLIHLLIAPVQAEELTPQMGIDAIRNIVADKVNRNTQDINNISKNQNEFVYEYDAKQVYRIYCAENRVVDIQFQIGEEIIYTGGADTVRWVVDKDISGESSHKQNHVFIKATQPSITTNLVITTTKRTYHLELISTDFYTPIVRWTYPLEDQLSILRMEPPKTNESTPEEPSGNSLTAENLNFNYTISGNNYAWKPVMVFDDGVKTYIKMPGKMQSSEAPALFVKLEDNTLALTNYRVVNGYYIIDRLGNNFEMKIGNNVVTIIKNE